MSSKKIILIFIDSYLPGYKAGGPIKSVSSMVAYLKNDFDFLIFTSNTDIGDQKPYPSIISDTWIKVDESTSIFYTSKEFLNPNKLLSLIKSIEFDLIYINSFFSFYYSILPLFFYKRNLISCPIIVAPRGMLGKGALQLKSLKKKLFIGTSKLIGLHKKICWHATSEQERQEIIKIYGIKANIKVASNLQYNVRIINPTPTIKNKGEVKFFFLSRISEKKNLIFSLEALAQFQKPGKIIFDIYGPIEDEKYWQKCLQLIKALNSCGHSINYKGGIPNDQVNKVIRSYHFLFLPTLNENYGHAIVESFLNGKPVIISDQTPWRNLKKHNVGWDIPLNNISQYNAVVEECIQMDFNQYEQMFKDTLYYANKYCLSDNTAKDLKKMFEEQI